MARRTEWSTSPGPMYAAIAAYNLVLLVTHILFIVWSIRPDARHQHASESFSFVVLFVFINITALVSLATFLAVQYYGRFVPRARHYSLRFYSVSTTTASCILYVWLVIAVAFQFRQRDIACVSIIGMCYMWFCLALFLCDVLNEWATRQRHITSVQL